MLAWISCVLRTCHYIYHICYMSLLYLVLHLQDNPIFPVFVVCDFIVSRIIVSRFAYIIIIVGSIINSLLSLEYLSVEYYNIVKLIILVLLAIYINWSTIIVLICIPPSSN